MIECIDNYEELPGIENEWNELYKSSGVDNLFLSYTWLCNWMRWFSCNQHIVLLNRSGSKLSSLGIFQRSRKKVAFISINHSYWPNVLSEQGTDSPMRPFLDYFHAQKSIEWISMQSSPGDEEFQTQLTSAADDRYFNIRHFPHCTRSISLEDSLDGFLNTRSKKVRKELRRKHRHLKREMRNISLVEFNDPSDVDTVFQKLSHIEDDCWKKDYGTAIICSENEISFYRGTYCFNEKEIKGKAFFLMNGDEPIAYVIGVFYHRRFYALKTSYQAKFAAHSPGQMLFYYLIEHLSSSEREIDAIELLGGDSRWKKELASDEKMLCNIELLRKSIKSRGILVAWNHILPRIEKFTHKHPKVLSFRNDIVRRTRRFFE